MKLSLNHLYIVSTPIGNLGDITYRAIEILKKSDLILCEDTRISKKVMEKFDVKSKLFPNHKFNEKKNLSLIINHLRNDKIISLVSDAGTPGISDPGAILVRECVKEKINIFPLPGPAAVCVAAAPDFGLNPLTIGLISASAEALGEMTGYIAGVSGKSLIQRQRLFSRAQGLVQRRGGIILFIGSMVPNPFFDLIGIAAGSVSYPIKKFLIVVFFAKAIKSISIAYACFMGIEWIQGYIG